MTQPIEYTVIAHEAEEGGYWTEVPGLPGAGSQGETLDQAGELGFEAKIKEWYEQLGGRDSD